MTPTRNQRRITAKESAQQPPTLRQIPMAEWPIHLQNLIEVWRSRSFLVQLYAEPNDYLRMSVCRTVHNGDTWVDHVTWDELMALKRECGRGDLDALEVYPADPDIVNVANMRHLFFPPTPLSFKWKSAP